MVGSGDLINRILPDESLLEIFNRFEGSKSDTDSCSLVCKRWLKLTNLSRRTISPTPSNNPDALIKLLTARFVNIRNINIDGGSPIYLHLQNNDERRYSLADRYDEQDSEKCTLSDVGLSYLAQTNRLETLSLLHCPFVTSVGLESLVERCRFLKSLELLDCNIGDQSLAAVGQCCKQLENVKLGFGGLTDTGVIEIAVGCGKSLKALTLTGSKNITNLSLDVVGHNCTCLQTLSLEFLGHIDNLHEGMLSIARGCPSLKNLKLYCFNITDETLQVVGAYCLSLELLDLCDYYTLTERSFLAIGSGCKKLKSVTLTDCPSLSDRGLQAIASGCPGLIHLELIRCHSIETAGLESIGRSCPNLSELIIKDCLDVCGDAFLEVGRGCKRLEALELEECSDIGDDVLCHIARGCKGLKKLHIGQCEEIGNKGIVAFAANCQHLTDLKISGCHSVEDDALIAIGKSCSSLQRLDVSSCNLIGDAGVIAVARGCPQLVYLNVDLLKRLGDAALAEIGEGCPLLKDIVISSCRQITDAGLSHLVKKCRLLESCCMDDCPFISSSGVATVVSSCPNMKKILIEKCKVTSRTRRRANYVLFTSHYFDL